MQRQSLFGGRKFVGGLLAIAIPMMLQQLITNLVNLLDNLMVGQIDAYAISGVATANRFFLIGSFAMMGTSTAASIFIAQFYGADNRAAMKESYRYGILVSALAFLPFLLGAIFIPETIIRFFSDDPLLLDAAMQYIRVAALTFIPLTISLTSMNALRAVGETKIPLVISLVTVVVNGLSNYVLILGRFGFPELGILGAALGTLMSRLVELILVIIALRRTNFAFKTKLKDLFRIPLRLIRTITTKSLPLMINEIGFAFGLAMLFKFYGTRGAEVQTAVSIAGTTADLFFVLFGGMAAATTVFVSQPLGKDDLQAAESNAFRILRFSVLMALVLGGMMFMLSWITPGLYAVDNEIRDMAALFIQVQSCFLWVYMINTECYFILRAGGDMRRTLILDSGYMVFVNLPIVAAAAYLTALPAIFVYIIGQATDVIKIFFSLRLLLKRSWLQNLAGAYSGQRSRPEVQSGGTVASQLADHSELNGSLPAFELELDTAHAGFFIVVEKETEPLVPD